MFTITTENPLVIGSDHAGFDYKTELISFLMELNIPYHDEGTYNKDSVDYPDFSHAVASKVSNNDSQVGVLICGSANGVAIAANKHKNVRAAICWNRDTTMLARSHNNANLLCLPARFISVNEAKEYLFAFLDTNFEGGRHATRVAKIEVA